MKGKYTHKFIIYHEKNMENNYNGLVDKLIILKDTIPADLVEELCEKSEEFKLGRKEFLEKFKNQIWAVDEILAIDDETNIACNKVLAFAFKYPEFGSLIAGIDYFDGDDEYIERINPEYFSDGSECFADCASYYERFFLSYFYGVCDNQLNILLKDMGRTDLIQG